MKTQIWEASFYRFFSSNSLDFVLIWLPDSRVVWFARLWSAHSHLFVPVSIAFESEAFVAVAAKVCVSWPQATGTVDNAEQRVGHSPDVDHARCPVSVSPWDRIVFERLLWGNAYAFWLYLIHLGIRRLRAWGLLWWKSLGKLVHYNCILLLFIVTFVNILIFLHSMLGEKGIYFAVVFDQFLLIRRQDCIWWGHL